MASLETVFLNCVNWCQVAYKELALFKTDIDVYDNVHSIGFKQIDYFMPSYCNFFI